MKNIDVKSLIIGALITSTIFLGVGCLFINLDLGGAALLC
jgi:hypothetical protein